MIMAMVYNTHRCYTLLQSYDDVMDPAKCKSYKAFNIIKANSNTFADFCRDAAKALEVADNFRDDFFFGDAVANVDEEESNHINDQVTRPVYKSRERYFKDIECITLRLDKTKNHQQVVLLQSQKKQCIMCCRLNHDENAVVSKCKGRQGYKTGSFCTLCNVHLCYVAGYGGKTCFDLFHDVEAMNDPCAIDGEVAKVARVGQRHSLPPSRKRDADNEPNARARGGMFTSSIVRCKTFFDVVETNNSTTIIIIFANK
jgi:hypothetical protein